MPSPISSPGGPPPAGFTPSTSSASSSARRASAAPAAVATTRSRRRRGGRAGRRRAGRARAARAATRRRCPPPPAPARPAARPPAPPPAGRAAAAGIGAQRHAPSARSQPEPAGAALRRRPARGPSRVQQLLQERAAQRLLGLVLRLDDRDLGQRGDRRHVQVLAGVGRPRRRASARRRARCPPETIGTSAVTSARPLRACPPASRAPRSARTRAHPSTGHPEPRHDHRDRRTGVSGGDLRHPLEPVAGQHGAHHFQVGAARRGAGLRCADQFQPCVSAQPLTSVRPRGGPGGPPRPSSPVRMRIAVLDRHDEDLPVADGPRPRVAQDRLLTSADVPRRRRRTRSSASAAGGSASSEPR